MLKNNALMRLMAAVCWAGLALFDAGCSSGQPPAPAPVAAPNNRYENKLVRRPGTTPEDGKVYLVKDGKKRWVVNASWLTGHGFRFPEDVKEISAAELEIIPTGDPIQ